jgi:hypothetical protein
MTKLLFESCVCSRCCGSGHHSYCQMYGTTCFKCNGRGVVLTKRGAEAQRYYNELGRKPAPALVPGDVIFDSFAGTKHRVLSAPYPDPLNPGHIKVDCEGCDWGFVPKSICRLVLPPEKRAENVKLALAYQSRLTKAGKEMKRAPVTSEIMEANQ